MYNRIPREIIQEIQSRTSLVDVVSQHVTLRKQGRSWLGLCPFHSEKNPSFHVDEQKGLFYCFGCQTGGDVFKFITQVENRSFPEVARELAERCGVVIPEPEMSPEERLKADEREALLGIHEQACRYFEDVLYSNYGIKAVEYLQGRALPPDVAERFRLGYAPPGWNGFVDHLQGSFKMLQSARAAGLVLDGNSGPYDRFRDRVIFPITNTSGRVIAFGGRILGEGQPKYLNSPESPLFVKGEALYGLTEARKAIGQEDSVLIVEGYFDVLLLYAYGIQNVVATCGTSLTRAHLRLLRRYTRNVVVMFDGDSAGQKAAARSLDLFLEEEMWPWFMPLPTGKDPDEVVRDLGTDAFRERMLLRKPLVDHLLVERCSTSVRTGQGADQLLTELAPILLKLPPPRLPFYVNMISEHTGLQPGVVEEQLGRLRRSTRTSQVENKPIEVRIDLPADEELLVQLLVHMGQEVAQLASQWQIVDHMTHTGLRQVAQALVSGYLDASGPNLGALLEGVEDEALRRRLAGLFMKEPDFPMVSRALEQLFLKIRMGNLGLQIRSLQDQVARLSRSGSDPEELTRLVILRMELVRENDEIKRRLARSGA